MMHSGSNCSRGVRVDVYWRFCAAGTDAGHIDAIVDALMDVLRKPANRRWNPFSENIVRAKILVRIQDAAAGRLRPVDEVKILRAGREVPGTREPLYEIRWNDLTVAEDPGNGGPPESRETALRLFFAEPDQLGYCMLGLVGHEKIYADPCAKQKQDDAIRDAEVMYTSGYNELWGITPRA